jgi:hypothetical protein
VPRRENGPLPQAPFDMNAACAHRLRLCRLIGTRLIVVAWPGFVGGPTTVTGRRNRRPAGKITPRTHGGIRSRTSWPVE